MKTLRFWMPPTLWAVVIFLFSTLPTVKTFEFYWWDFTIKKSAHIIEYGIFSLLLYRAFINTGVDRKKAAIYSILISVLYGLTDEYHQGFTPGREPKLRDVGFDTIGAILAIYSIWNLLPKMPKKLKSWAKSWRLI
ncbi:VanZ family protein [Candidatus Woesebacteria bacterium]|nr:VanZ family protein [Candidatus Woesebacteria bacterium]